MKYYYRLAKFILHILIGNFKKFTMPFKLTYIITKNCNSKCLNCNIWQEVPENELELDEINHIAKKLTSIRWIDFSGGEPVLREDFYDIVKSFYKRLPSLTFIHFPTNGLQTQKTVDLCKKLTKFKGTKLVVTVSIDGPQEVNDIIRGVPGGFKKSIETYKELKEIGVETYIGMTLFKSNQNKVDALVENLKKEIPGFNRESLHLNYGQESEHFYDNIDSDCRPDRLQEFKLSHVLLESIKLLSPLKFVEFLYLKNLKKFHIQNTTPIPCRSLETSIYISEKGEVFPCSMWNYPIGNLRDNHYSFSKLKEKEKYDRALKLIKEEKCSHCWTPCEAYQSILTQFNKSLF